MSSSDAPAASSRLRAFMAIPLVLAAAALIGALWVLFKLQQGRPAAGDRVALHFQTECAPRAAEVLRKRADAIGLGEPVVAEEPGGLLLTATLPGLPDDRTAIPALLAAPGRLELRLNGSALATEEDVVQTAINMDAGGTPYMELTLNGLAVKEIHEAATSGAALEVALDGAVLLSEDAGALRDDKLRLFPSQGTPAERMRAAVDWTILLGSGPLPCAVAVGPVAEASQGG